MPSAGVAKRRRILIYGAPAFFTDQVVNMRSVKFGFTNQADPRVNYVYQTAKQSPKHIDIIPIKVPFVKIFRDTLSAKAKPLFLTKLRVSPYMLTEGVYDSKIFSLWNRII